MQFRWVHIDYIIQSYISGWVEIFYHGTSRKLETHKLRLYRWDFREPYKIHNHQS